jgi:hypothetical protein
LIGLDLLKAFDERDCALRFRLLRPLIAAEACRHRFRFVRQLVVSVVIDQKDLVGFQK